jgi:hypothetical protein
VKGFIDGNNWHLLQRYPIQHIAAELCARLPTLTSTRTDFPKGAPLGGRCCGSLRLVSLGTRPSGIDNGLSQIAQYHRSNTNDVV